MNRNQFGKMLAFAVSRLASALLALLVLSAAPPATAQSALVRVNQVGFPAAGRSACAARVEKGLPV